MNYLGSLEIKVWYLSYFIIIPKLQNLLVNNYTAITLPLYWILPLLGGCPWPCASFRLESGKAWSLHLCLQSQGLEGSSMMEMKSKPMQSSSSSYMALCSFNHHDTQSAYGCWSLGSGGGQDCPLTLLWWRAEALLASIKGWSFWVAHTIGTMFLYVVIWSHLYIFSLSMAFIVLLPIWLICKMD